MDDRTLIKDIIIYIFEEMNSQNIEYCVLKNYENLPESLDAQDIDILVKSKYISNLKMLFFKLPNFFPIENILFSRKGYLNRFEIITSKNKSRVLLVFEFWTGIDWYCFPMFSCSDILSHRIKHKFFYVASPFHTILICWLVPFIYGGTMKGKYKKLFHSVSENSKKEVISELSKVFGSGLAKKISNELEKGNFDITSLRNVMRTKIIFLSFVKYRFLPLRLFLILSYDVLKHYMHICLIKLHLRSLWSKTSQYQ